MALSFQLDIIVSFDMDTDIDKYIINDTILMYRFTDYYRCIVVNADACDDNDSIYTLGLNRCYCFIPMKLYGVLDLISSRVSEIVQSVLDTVNGIYVTYEDNDTDEYVPLDKVIERLDTIDVQCNKILWRISSDDNNESMCA